MSKPVNAQINAIIRLLRLHQPVGIALLVLPCWWSLAWVRPMPDVALFVLFLLGAALMRSAGCVINDLTDRTLDAQVERTRLRPLASGEISVFTAYVILALLLTGALGVALLLGSHVVMWSVFALPMVVAYPWMKRITWWPQAWLAVTFNWGVIVASVAATKDVSFGATALYLAALGWTFAYDTIYAFQDIADDVKANIRSSARALGARAKRAVAVSYGWMFAWLFAAMGLRGEVHIAALAGMMGLAFWTLWRLRALNLDDRAACGKFFNENAGVGLGVFLALL